MGICFGIYLLFLLLFPNGSIYGPDEECRVAVSQFIAENDGTLPTGFEENLRIPGWGFSYALDMKLPYIISAGFAKIIQYFSSTYNAVFKACRMTSLLSGVGVCWMSIILGKKLFKGYERWIYIFLMSLTPQIVFLSSYLNLDIFSLFTVLVILNAWFDALAENWSVKSCLELGAGLGLCLVSYSFAYGYIFASFFLYVIWFVVHVKEESFRRFIVNGFIVLGITLLISGWMFIRNYTLYDGDIFCLHNREVAGELFGSDFFKPSLHWTYKKDGKSILYMLLHSDFIELSFRSFICVLGPMAYRGSILMYAFYTILILTGIIGFCGFKMNSDEKWIAIFGSIASLIAIACSAYYSWSTDYEPQGRYIITIAPMLFGIVSFGIGKILEKSAEKKSIICNCICAAIALSTLEGFIICLKAYIL